MKTPRWGRKSKIREQISLYSEVQKHMRKTTARKKKNKINEKFTSEEVKITEQSEKSLINRFRALKEIKKHEIH